MSFEEGVEVEYESLKVLRTLLQLPDLLVAAGFIVEDADYDVLVYGFSTTRSIF